MKRYREEDEDIVDNDASDIDIPADEVKTFVEELLMVAKEELASSMDTDGDDEIECIFWAMVAEIAEENLAEAEGAEGEEEDAEEAEHEADEAKAEVDEEIAEAEGDEEGYEAAEEEEEEAEEEEEGAESENPEFGWGHGDEEEEEELNEAIDAGMTDAEILKMYEGWRDNQGKPAESTVWMVLYDPQKSYLKVIEAGSGTSHQAEWNAVNWSAEDFNEFAKEFGAIQIVPPNQTESVFKAKLTQNPTQALTAANVGKPVNVAFR